MVDAEPNVLAVMEWADRWERSHLFLQRFILTPNKSPTGHDLDREAWVRLNRLRSGCRGFKTTLHKVDLAASPLRECGVQQTAQTAPS